jgi:hypothetical protein
VVQRAQKTSCQQQLTTCQASARWAALLLLLQQQQLNMLACSCWSMKLPNAM